MTFRRRIRIILTEFLSGEHGRFGFWQKISKQPKTILALCKNKLFHNGNRMKISDFNVEEGGSNWKENICHMGKNWQKRQNFPMNIFNDIIDYSFLPENLITWSAGIDIIFLIGCWFKVNILGASGSFLVVRKIFPGSLASWVFGRVGWFCIWWLEHAILLDFFLLESRVTSILSFSLRNQNGSRLWD